MAAEPAAPGSPPEPIGRQRQKKPREVEEQFHLEKRTGDTKDPKLDAGTISFSEMQKVRQCDQSVREQDGGQDRLNRTFIYGISRIMGE